MIFKRFIHDKTDNLQICNVSQLEKKIYRVGYVSFNFSDSLLIWEIPSPTDVFTIVEYMMFLISKGKN